MRLIRGAVLVAVIGVAVGVTAAQAGSALEMASYCKPVAEAKHLGGGRVIIDNTYETGKCWGFFNAIQEASRMKFVGESTPALQLCLPEKSTLTQMVLIFRRYVDSHPAEAHDDAFFIAWKALRKAFPCKD